jgi:hypothetical protein
MTYMMFHMRWTPLILAVLLAPYKPMLVWMKKCICLRDKWFGPNQMTKGLWDLTDDNGKLIILGYNKSSSPFPFPSRPPSKPPFPPKQRRGINLH